MRKNPLSKYDKKPPMSVIESFATGMSEIRKTTPDTATQTLRDTIARAESQGGGQAGYARELRKLLVTWLAEDAARKGPAQASLPGLDPRDD